jgi:5-methylcytosine-specific restriction endonuclease McrA
MTEAPKGRAQRETLEIPADVREAVDARDGYVCRVCGEFLGRDRRAIHHIRYGGDVTGMGGRRHHDPAEMITVGWLPGQDCHSIVHSRKLLWQPLLLAVVGMRGVTAMQLKRWQTRERRRER